MLFRAESLPARILHIPWNRRAARRREQELAASFQARTALFFSLLLAAAALVSGCLRQEIPAVPDTKNAEYRKQYQEGRVVVTLDRVKIAAGQKFHLAVAIHSATEPVAVLELPEDSSLSVAEEHSSSPARSGDEWHREWELFPGPPGKETVPPLRIDLGTLTVTTAPISVEVLSLSSGSKMTLRDIEPPVASLPRGPLPIRLALGVALVAAGAAALLFLWARRRRSSVPLSPRAAALRALQDLEAEGLPRSGSYEPHYTRMSRILRQYLKSQFGFPALRWTSRELLAAAKADGRFAPEQCELLGELLRHWDGIKFGREHPPEEWHSKALSLCRDFVLATSPEPEPAVPPR